MWATSWGGIRGWVLRAVIRGSSVRSRVRGGGRKRSGGRMGREVKVRKFHDARQVSAWAGRWVDE